MSSAVGQWRFIRCTRVFLLLALVIIASACATSMRTGNQAFPVQLTQATWAVKPVVNGSRYATASDTVASLIETQLYANGIQRLNQRRADYAISGKLHEWRYNNPAMERYPTVSMDLAVQEVATGDVIWRGSHSHTGRLIKTLSGVGNKVVAELIAEFKRDIDAVDIKAPTTLNLAQNTNSSVVVGSELLNESNSGNVSGVSSALRTSGASVYLNAKQTNIDVVGKSVAFYYGVKPPVSVLSQFDRIILESDNITNEELAQLKVSEADLFAYVSVGEIGKDRDWASKISPSWVLGVNEHWGSSVLDLGHAGWVSFLYQRVDELVAQGYGGLFLDTMDSFLIYAKTEEQREVQQRGLESIISGIKARHPQLKLIANRGFEVLDGIGEHLDAIAAESLFVGWNNSAQEYQPVNTQDRQWLTNKLTAAKQQFGLDVIAIDYLPPERRDEARQIASDIVDLGFIPWVSTPTLDYIGVGAQEVMPREVILIYDGAKSQGIENSHVHKLIATPLEYYGYVPVYVDIASDNLPGGELKGVVAGVVSWVDGIVARDDYKPWLKKQMQSDVPVALFGSLGIAADEFVLEKLAVAPLAQFDFNSAAIRTQDNLIGFERNVIPRFDSISIGFHSASETNNVHLGFVDNNDVKLDAVITGPWGGVALDPFAAAFDPDGVDYWTINPFDFLQTALKLPLLPMPDVTTLTGKRLWLAHIDGDALPSWAEMPGKRLGAEVIYDEILEPYQLPHSISVVEAELTAFPKFIDRKKRMFDVARKILNAPYVEAASHTHSHPFKWKKVAGRKESGKYNLRVPGYSFSFERETLGSLAFINNQLLENGKKAELLLWSGDALPGEEVLGILSRNNLHNLNGGNTTISKSKASISAVSPMARTVGGYTQVYAPIMNENVYTNDWTGPFDGFRRVIETFEMTDQPRRLKPVNIYYHFYTGTKIAAMRALEEVYEWSLAQEVHPVYASEYAELVPAFRQAGVSRYLDGTWKVSSLGPIQSLRILDKDTWPEVAGSVGISGATALHDGVYIHTAGNDTVLFNLNDKRPSDYHLVSANGRVQYWNTNGSSVRFRISGHVPLEVELRGTQGCSIISQGKMIRGTRTNNGNILYKLPTRDSFDAVLNCQA